MAENWGPTLYGGSQEGEKIFTPPFSIVDSGGVKNFREGETPSKKE